MRPQALLCLVASFLHISGAFAADIRETPNDDSNAIDAIAAPVATRENNEIERSLNDLPVTAEPDDLSSIFSKLATVLEIPPNSQEEKPAAARDERLRQPDDTSPTSHTGLLRRRRGLVLDDLNVQCKLHILTIIAKATPIAKKGKVIWKAVTGKAGQTVDTVGETFNSAGYLLRKVAVLGGPHKAVRILTGPAGKPRDELVNALKRASKSVGFDIDLLQKICRPKKGRRSQLDETGPTTHTELVRRGKKNGDDPLGQGGVWSLTKGERQLIDCGWAVARIAAKSHAGSRLTKIYQMATRPLEQIDKGAYLYDRGIDLIRAINAAGGEVKSIQILVGPASKTRTELWKAVEKVGIAAGFPLDDFKKSCRLPGDPRGLPAETGPTTHTGLVRCDEEPKNWILKKLLKCTKTVGTIVFKTHPATKSLKFVEMAFTIDEMLDRLAELYNSYVHLDKTMKNAGGRGKSIRILLGSASPQRTEIWNALERAGIAAGYPLDDFKTFCGPKKRLRRRGEIGPTTHTASPATPASAAPASIETLATTAPTPTGLLRRGESDTLEQWDKNLDEAIEPSNCRDAIEFLAVRGNTYVRTVKFFLRAVWTEKVTKALQTERRILRSAVQLESLRLEHGGWGKCADVLLGPAGSQRTKLWKAAVDLGTKVSHPLKDFKRFCGPEKGWPTDPRSPTRLIRRGKQNEKEGKWIRRFSKCLEAAAEIAKKSASKAKIKNGVEKVKDKITGEVVEKKEILNSAAKFVKVVDKLGGPAQCAMILFGPGGPQRNKLIKAARNVAFEFDFGSAMADFDKYCSHTNKKQIEAGVGGT